MKDQDILQQIDLDFKEAYRKKDKTKASVLRILKAALKNAEIAQQRKSLSAEEVQAVIRGELNQRKESLAEWEKAGRTAEAEEERKAIEILEQYLPPSLSPEEIRKIAEKAIEEVGASSPQDMGKVMGVLMPRLKGRADGKAVSSIVQDLLSSQ